MYLHVNPVDTKTSGIANEDKMASLPENYLYFDTPYQIMMLRNVMKPYSLTVFISDPNIFTESMM